MDKIEKEYLEQVKKLLSPVRFRTVAELRPDLPDLPWRDVAPEVAEEFGKVFRALNMLLATREAEVRSRHVRDVFDREGRIQERHFRQEWKLATPRGGKRAEHMKFNPSFAPSGAY